MRSTQFPTTIHGNTRHCSASYCHPTRTTSTDNQEAQSRLFLIFLWQTPATVELAHISVATNHVDVLTMCFDHELLSYFGFVQIRIYLITVCSGVSVTPPLIRSKHTTLPKCMPRLLSNRVGAPVLLFWRPIIVIVSHCCNCVPIKLQHKCPTVGGCN